VIELGRILGASSAGSKLRNREIPMEPYEIAQEGLKQLKQAVIALLKSRPDGLRNVEIASALGIRSDHDGKQEDYLSYSILGLLMRSGVVVKSDESTYRLFTPRPE
jgi:uncharacterized protein